MKVWYSNTMYINDNTDCGKRGNCKCNKYHNIWHSFANKTKFYNEIFEYLEFNKNIL